MESDLGWCCEENELGDEFYCEYLLIRNIYWMIRFSKLDR